MSIFKKMLASIGIGAAKVDTRLYDDNVIPGGLLNGEVDVTGGNVSQEIDEIYLYVATQYKRESGDGFASAKSIRTYREECKLLKHRVSEAFTIQPKENRVIPFSLTVPYETPVTFSSSEVYLRTGLDIAMAINPRDWDNIQVHPHPLMQKVLDAVNYLGFHLYQVDCEYNPRLGEIFPFIQDFEFRPMGKYLERLDELEVIFYLQPNQLEVFLQIDKRVRGFGSLMEEAFNLDERYTRFYVRPEDLEYPTNNLADKIDEIIQSRL